eukprot:GFKZ01011684.1.p3 GENE.GFKZ01011684.1~~GFKZ01011684.1.p3  ORF type:complete len:102 (+),score=26.48 GFKZ01011684.1:51-356(+)
MAPIISNRASRAGQQVVCRPVAVRPSAPTRNVRASGFFDDLKKAASSVTEKLSGTANDAAKAADKVADEVKDAAKDVKEEVKDAAAEAGKAAEAVKDAADK